VEHVVGRSRVLDSKDLCDILHTLSEHRLVKPNHNERTASNAMNSAPAI